MKGICPVCGKPNHCAMTEGKDPYSCWCMSIKVPKPLLASIPEEKRGESCICESCVIAYKMRFDSIAQWVEDAVIDLKYMTSDNFVKRVLYDKSYDILRVGTLQKLQVAANTLRDKGYRLVIWDAYRPVAVQQIFWDIVGDARFVAPPWTGSSHNRGCAVDVTLCDLAGTVLEMPTAFDDFSSRAKACPDGLLDAIKTRVIHLQEAMVAAGFKIYEHEWWHFNDSDIDLYPIE